MANILIFDQAEYPGGSIARAVDLAMSMPEHRFWIATYHPLSYLYPVPLNNHISSLRLFSFYNYQKKRSHLNSLYSRLQGKLARHLGQKIIAALDWINEISLSVQLYLRLLGTRIEVVQSNSGIHFLPYRFAKRKGAALIYYFRHLDDYRWALGNMVSRACRFIFVSNALMAHHKQLLGLNSDDCEVIHSPFDSEARLAKGVAENESLIEELKRNNAICVLQAARVCKEKGQSVAIDAIQKLQYRYPQLVLLIAGEEDLEYASQLKQRVKDQGLEKKVYFLGHRRDVLHLLRKVDIALQTPIWFESLSGSLIEAMQLGVLTVSANSGGAQEAIDHGNTGFLFEPGNSAELAEILSSILEQRVDTASIARNGQRYALEHWAPAAITSAMQRVYAQALSNTKNCDQ